MNGANEEKFEQVKSVLILIVNDQSVPKNIRHAAKTSIDSLNAAKNTTAMKAYGVIRRLDDTSQAPNCPLQEFGKWFQYWRLLWTNL